MSRKTFCELVKGDIPDYNEKELWIFGAGMTAGLYGNGLQRLEEEGFVISGYIDNNKDKWGREFNGKTIVSFEDILKKKDKVFVLLCSYYSKVNRAIGKQLDDAGIPYSMIDNIVFKNHADKLINVYDLLDDEESKNIYETLVTKRMTGDDSDLPVSLNEQYFGLGHFISNNPNEVFLDCGSYVGDSLERYIWKNEGVFGKILAFEPDEHNVKAMKYRIHRLSNEWGFDDSKIIIYEKGLSDSNSAAKIVRSDVNNGFSSNLVVGDDNTDGDVVRLDSLITEPISFLKADIESWEYKMLLGAKNTIEKYKPKMAICIYHNAADFYEIALLIKSIVPEYKFAVRHHSTTLCETVLYSWVD